MPSTKALFLKLVCLCFTTLLVFHIRLSWMGKHVTLYQTKGCCFISKHLVFIPVKQRLHFLSGDTKVSDAKLLATVCSELSLSFTLFRASFLTQCGLDVSFKSALLLVGPQAGLDHSLSPLMDAQSRHWCSLLLNLSTLLGKKEKKKNYLQKKIGRRSLNTLSPISKPSFTQNNGRCLRLAT